jgi:hypothetical protein
VDPDRFYRSGENLAGLVLAARCRAIGRASHSRPCPHVFASAAEVQHSFRHRFSERKKVLFVSTGARVTNA